MLIKTRAALVAATLAAGLGVILAPAASTATAAQTGTSAVTCSGWKSIRVYDNAAGLKYKECDRTVNGKKQTSAALYLWDNKRDGRIAQAYVQTGYTHWHGYFKETWDGWYGWGKEAHHSPRIETGWHDGNDVRMRLSNPRG